MEYSIHLFDNGIRLVHKHVASMVAHFGIVVHTGSRDEKENEHGMAHFIEHVLFKGTRKRKAFHILSRLENAGGEINAYTTKEETCIYSSFLKQDYERSIELIYDIFFHSSFPEKEINREKQVILDEILSYHDNPSELIFDDFEEQVFKGMPIGRNILGTEKNLEAFTRKDILDFLKNNYATREIVLSSVGNIDFNRLVLLCGKYFGMEPEKKRIRNRLVPNGYNAEFKSIIKDTYQIHCIVGNLAYKVRDPRRTGMHLLSNILGGPGMNSRLNMSLREKNGYSYNVESHYTPYTDTGIFMVYFSCDKEKFDKSLSLVYKEFDKMCKDRLGTLQLSKAKKQLIGQVAISNESNEHLMLAIGKSLLVFDYVDTLEEIKEKIEAVTTVQLLEIANEILENKHLSVLKYS
jgi:predicted Zn-dependent peptidase